MIGFAVAFLVAAALLLQFLINRRDAGSISIDHAPSVKCAEAGEEFDLILTLSNPTWHLFSYLLIREKFQASVEINSDRFRVKKSGNDETIAYATTFLAPYQRLTRRIPITISKRGCMRFLGPEVYVGDFLGIDERRSSGIYDSIREIVIYPKAIDDAGIKTVFGGFLGEMSTNRFLYEDPVLTLGFNEYTGREPMKRISWTRTAQMGRLMVKNMDYTMDDAVTLALDVNGISEAECEMAYSLARTVLMMLEEKHLRYDFAMNAVPYGGSTEWQYIQEGQGAGHYFGILEGLGRGMRNTYFSGEELLERVAKRASRGHGVIFIVGGRYPALEKAARDKLAQAGATLLYICAADYIDAGKNKGADNLREAMA